MKKLFLFIWLCQFLLVLFLFEPTGLAQEAVEVRMAASVSTAKVPLNQTLDYSITVEWSGESDRFGFDFPPKPDLVKLEIVGSSSSNQKLIKDGQPFTQKEFRYLLRPLETGTGSIGKISLEYSDKVTGTREILQTQAQEIEIGSAQYPFIERVKPYILPSVAVTAFLVMLFWFIRLIKKRKTRKKIPETTRALPVEEIYIPKLKELETLIPVGESQRLYNSYYEYLKAFLKEKWGVTLPAGESAREELLEKFDIAQSLKENLVKIFKTCDLVKFAGTRPGPEEMRNALVAAYDLINSTKTKESIILKGAVDNHEP